MAPDGPAVLLDTSVWIRVLNGDPRTKDILDAHAEADLFTHPLVIAELSAASLRGRTKRSSVVEEVEAISVLQELTREDAIEGATTWVRLRKAGRDKVSLADCLILATARRVGATLVTSDTDLRREKGVVLV